MPYYSNAGEKKTMGGAPITKLRPHYTRMSVINTRRPPSRSCETDLVPQHFDHSWALMK